MDRSDVIYLMAGTTATSANGVKSQTYTERLVYCQVLSITRAEFFDAGRNGLNPDFEFVIFADDYEGERLVRYHGETYAVYRTYRRRDDNLELYVQREGGANAVRSGSS